MSNIEYYDLHIHSEWSDGEDSIEEIIQTAEEKGLKVIGICDHLSEFKASIPYDEPNGVEDYFADVKECAERHKNIKVFVGLEIDVFPVDKLEMDINKLNYFDYLLFEDVTKLQTLKKFTTWAKEFQTKNKQPPKQ